MIEVELTVDEMRYAEQVGRNRNKSANNLGYKDSYGLNPELAVAKHVEGAQAELAVAKALGIDWQAQVKTRGSWTDIGDVGYLEVRSTKHEHGSLILHDKDKDDRIYILVIGESGRYKIVGFILARDGKKAEYWGDKKGTGRPAYWIPQDHLIPIEVIAETY